MKQYVLKEKIYLGHLASCLIKNNVTSTRKYVVNVKLYSMCERSSKKTSVSSNDHKWLVQTCVICMHLCRRVGRCNACIKHG